MKYFQKILLLAFTTLLVLLFVAVIFFNLLVQKRAVDFDFIFPVFFIVTGIFSFFFHVKTLKFYKANTRIKEADLTFNVYWIVNAVFGFGLVILAILFLYVFSTLMDTVVSEQLVVFAIMVGISFSLGVWLLIDQGLLYKEFKRVKSKILIEDIDNINGNKEGLI